MLNNELELTSAFEASVERNKEAVGRFCDFALRQYFDDSELRELYFERNYGTHAFLYSQSEEIRKNFIGDIIAIEKQNGELPNILRLITIHRPFLKDRLVKDIPDLGQSRYALEMFPHIRMDAQKLETFHFLTIYPSRSELSTLVSLLQRTDKTETFLTQDHSTLTTVQLAIITSYFCHANPSSEYDEAMAHWKLDNTCITQLKNNLLSLRKEYPRAQKVSTETRAPREQSAEFEYKDPNHWNNLASNLYLTLNGTMPTQTNMDNIVFQINNSNERASCAPLALKNLRPAFSEDGLRIGGLCLWAMRHGCIKLLLKAASDVFRAEGPYVFNNFNSQASAFQRGFLES